MRHGEDVEATVDLAFPPGHDPSSRVVVHVAAGWELRVGGGVVQAWAPRARVSVLRIAAPSRVGPEVLQKDWIFLVSSRAAIASLVHDEWRLSFPVRARFDAVERWFLRTLTAPAMYELAAYAPERS